MPPRADEELDPVSLHNTGLMRMEAEPASGFRKLNFLISNPPFPPGEQVDVFTNPTPPLPHSNMLIFLLLHAPVVGPPDMT